MANGKVAAEGSTNWSVSGEGELVISGSAGGPGYKAQNNTQLVITDPDTVARFTAELIAEHMAAQHPAVKRSDEGVVTQELPAFRRCFLGLRRAAVKS